MSDKDSKREDKPKHYVPGKTRDNQWSPPGRIEKSGDKSGSGDKDSTENTGPRLHDKKG